MEKNKVTRGIRNNNPGNIVRNNVSWKGLRKNQTDKRFFQFCSVYYGLRALMKLLHTYYYKYHLHTINGIISRYAPSNENNTNAYIDFVMKRCSVVVDPFVDLSFPFVSRFVLMAICEFESSYKPPHTLITKVFNETFNKNSF